MESYLTMKRLLGIDGISVIFEVNEGVAALDIDAAAPKLGEQ